MTKATSGKKEIERKFLVIRPDWKNDVSASHRIVQGYVDPTKKIATEPGLILIDGSKINVPIEWNEQIRAASSETAEGTIPLGKGRWALRLRRKSERTIITLKGPGNVARDEWEADVDAESAAVLDEAAAGRIVEKVRHLIPVRKTDALVFEVDAFEGNHFGLVLAEIELPEPDHPFERPAWLGREVTFDPAYANAELAEKQRLPPVF
jgi:adenylate cyclase